MSVDPTRGIETDFKLCKRVADDEAFARVLVDWPYERFRKEADWEPRREV